MRLFLSFSLGERPPRTTYEGEIKILGGLIFGRLQDGSYTALVSGRCEEQGYLIELWPTCGAYARLTAFRLWQDDDWHIEPTIKGSTTSVELNTVTPLPPLPEDDP